MVRGLSPPQAACRISTARRAAQRLVSKGRGTPGRSPARRGPASGAGAAPLAQRPVQVAEPCTSAAPPAQRLVRAAERAPAPPRQRGGLVRAAGRAPAPPR